MSVTRIAAAGRAGAAAGLLLLLAACGPGDAKTCGPGTTLENGACVARLTCGDGLVAADGGCVPAAVDGGAPDGGAPDGGEDGGEDGGACEPACDGRACGDDGCGGACGTCAADKQCSLFGTCVTPASCAPACGEKECGDDGCGGSCGTCDDLARPVCQAGRCVSECVPDCYGGKECGDNGCGGTCGTCAAASTCDGRQHCVPDAWTCDDSRYADEQACDCGCGVPDPDCAHDLAIAGCHPGETCGPAGTCVSGAPTGWTCEKRFYEDGLVCNCECGVPDPDCAAGRAVLGCSAGAVCRADGTCGTCTPACDGKSCGPDGCGGSCGRCDDEQRPLCVAGACVNACHPSPVACTTAECGDDGCGGSCGTCAAGLACRGGRCEALVSDDTASCRLRCGSVAPSGCSCSNICTQRGTCCADWAAECGCTPRCDGKSCGDDGCGGTCGTCPSSARHCTAEGTCTAACTPRCDGKSCGDDGCGGSCGPCAAGSTCAFTGQCVPDRWTCDAFDYGERLGCDCGCGAPDPDCEDEDLPIARCPRGAACLPTGFCDITTCDADGDCGALQCLGLYAIQPGVVGGQCGPAYPGAEPPGASCEVNEDCANDVCLAGVCRRHCAADADCPFGQHCLGEPVLGPTHKVEGFAAVCERPAGSLAPCARQSACPAHEVCLPFIDPATKGPRYLCAAPQPGGGGPGASCETSRCAPGLFCEGAPGSRVCAKACPGGVTDCPAQWRCKEIVFHDFATTTPTDDPKVHVCAP